MRLDRGAPDRLGAMDRAGSLTTVTLDMATLYLIPLQPSADLSIWDTGLPTDLMSVRVSQKLGDKMARADFEFAGRSVGGVSGTLYGKTLFVKLPDHTGASQIVFAGAFRSSKSSYSPTQNSETMTAAQYQALLVYRQALRDITKNFTTLAAVVWPIPPTGINP